jgi:putative transposase
MSDKFKIYEKEKPYFVTLTIAGWVDVFTRKNHKLVIVDVLKYCQKHKMLEIFAWCLMSSHLHMIVRANGKYELWEVLRGFKKFTARKVLYQIQEDAESRREWMLKYFEYCGRHIKRVSRYKFWQDGNHAEIIYSPKFFYNKLNYIHRNPVIEMIVEKEEDYLFNSARNYADLDPLIEITRESKQLITY